MDHRLPLYLVERCIFEFFFFSFWGGKLEIPHEEQIQSSSLLSPCRWEVGLFTAFIKKSMLIFNYSVFNLKYDLSWSHCMKHLSSQTLIFASEAHLKLWGSWVTELHPCQSFSCWAAGQQISIVCNLFSHIAAMCYKGVYSPRAESSCQHLAILCD